MSSSSNSEYKCINPSCETRDKSKNKDFVVQNTGYPTFCPYCGAKLQIHNRYNILSCLAAGGFGIVFLTKDAKTGKKIALKQLTHTNPKAISLFQLEADKLKELGKHEQIPTFYEYFAESIRFSESRSKEDYLYLALEFIDGETLLQELDKNGKYKEADIQNFLLEILPVINFIHSWGREGIIHRDIKPDNIMRRKDNQSLVLIDFGIIKEVTQTNLSKTGTLVFTPGYAANEHIRGKAVKASDLYSLGVTCIHLLTGTHPEHIYNPNEDKFFWQEELLKKNIKISQYMTKILAKLLARTVSDRYKTCQEVLIDILPEVYIKENTLEIKANNKEDKFIKTITVENRTPNTKLVGSWEVLPYSKDKYKWIEFHPQSFTCSGGSSCSSKIVVDTSNLAKERKFNRTIRLTTNAYTRTYEINLEVKTAQIVSQIKILPLLSKLLILMTVCFIACICAVNSTYLTKIFTDIFQTIWNPYVYNYLMRLKNEYMQNVWQ